MKTQCCGCLTNHTIYEHIEFVLNAVSDPI
jgi:hypothetical protein